MVLKSLRRADLALLKKRYKYQYYYQNFNVNWSKMLPTLHRKAYQQLLDALTELRDHLSKASSTHAVPEKYKAVQQIFTEQVMSLQGNQVEPATLSRWQSVQTEIYRAYRLLQTDILFLRSSRQAATSKQRLETVCDRLDQLIGYCQALLQEE